MKINKKRKIMKAILLLIFYFSIAQSCATSSRKNTLRGFYEKTFESADGRESSNVPIRNIFKVSEKDKRQCKS